MSDLDPGYAGANQPAQNGQFAGSGTATNYADLGITATQANQRVTTTGASTTTQTNPVGLGGGEGASTSTPVPAQVVTIGTALAYYDQAINSDPALASQLQQQLMDAGLLPAGVAFGTSTATGPMLYTALKNAVLKASAAGIPLDQYLQNAAQTFQASGGYKVPLPTRFYPAPLTSYDTMATAADNAYQQIFGHDAPAAVKAALTQQLNVLETSSKEQEAQVALQGLLAQRQVLYPGITAGAPGTSTTGTQTGLQDAGLDTGTVGGVPAPGTAAAALPASTPPAQAAAAAGGQQVTSASGQQGTVSTGPLAVPYQQAPSASDYAIQEAKTANPAEYEATAIANAMQVISQFIGQK